MNQQVEHVFDSTYDFSVFGDRAVTFQTKASEFKHWTRKTADEMLDWGAYFLDEVRPQFGKRGDGFVECVEKGFGIPYDTVKTWMQRIKIQRSETIQGDITLKQIPKTPENILDAPVFTQDAMNNEFKRGMEQQRKLDEIELREQETRHNQNVQNARHQRVESLQKKIEKLEADKKELELEKKRLETLPMTSTEQQKIAHTEQKIQTLQVELSLLEHQHINRTRTLLKTAAEIALRDYLKVLSEADTQELDELASLVDTVKTDILHKRQPPDNHQYKCVDLDLDLNHL